MQLLHVVRKGYQLKGTPWYPEQVDWSGNATHLYSVRILAGTPAALTEVFRSILFPIRCSLIFLSSGTLELLTALLNDKSVKITVIPELECLIPLLDKILSRFRSHPILTNRLLMRSILLFLPLFLVFLAGVSKTFRHQNSVFANVSLKYGQSVKV